MSTKKESRNEREELVLRFFAFGDWLDKFEHDVADFLDAYLKDMNQRCKDDPELLAAYKERFNQTISFLVEHFPDALQREGRKQTPRVRFEALTVGAYLALQDREIDDPDTSWVSSQDFDDVTRTHAANSGPRLKARVFFVRDHLLGDSR